jgi:hypothetical protein
MLQFVPLLAFMIVSAGVVPGARAQEQVPSADIQRLDDSLDEVSASLADLRSTDPDLARRLQDDLADLREEVTYLRVKARKSGVSQDEYDDLRLRIADLRRAAAPGSLSSTPPPTDRSPESTPSMETADIPVGHELDVRIQAPLSSGTAQVEDRFEATTLVDVYQGDRVLVPAGSVMRGVVSGVEKAGRLDRKGSLTLAFDQLTVRGVDYPIRATVTQALESKGIRGEAARIGIGAAAGAVLGGILGGAQGALAGIFIGSGGVLAAVPGKDVELPAGTVLRVRFDSPVDLHGSR